MPPVLSGVLGDLGERVCTQVGPGSRPIAEGARPWSGSECGILAHPTLPPAVGDLRDFVRSHLGNPKLPFYLCKCFSGTSCSAALAPPSWGLKQLFPQKQHHGAGRSCAGV